MPPRYPKRKKKDTTKDGSKKKGKTNIKIPFLKSSTESNTNKLRNRKCICILDDESPSPVSSFSSKDNSPKNKDSHKRKYDIGSYVLPMDTDNLNVSSETSSSSTSSATFHTAVESEKQSKNKTKDKKRTKSKRDDKMTETSSESNGQDRDNEKVKLILEDFDNIIEDGNFNISNKDKRRKKGKTSKRARSVEKVFNLSKRLSYKIRHSEPFSPAFSPIAGLQLDFTSVSASNQENLCSDFDHVASGKKSKGRGKN